MNKHILTTAMAALLAGLPLRADDEASIAKSTVTTDKDGTVTLTVDINGKKETKTFKLGEGGGTVRAEADGNGRVKVIGLSSDAAKAPGKMVKATWLGVAVTHPLSEEVRAQLPLQAGEGIVVSHVVPESPAAKAGLEQHDVLSRLDDQVLVSSDQFQTLVKMHKPGDKTKVVFYRKGERKEVEVALAEHEVEERPAGDIFWKFDGDGAGAGLPNLEHLPDHVRERLEQFKAQGGNLRDRLKDMKEKFPGVIVEKKAFIVGPDGKVLGTDIEAVKDALEKVRKQLEDAKVPKEKIDEIHKALESAMDGVGDAAKKELKDAIRSLREKKDEKEKPGDLLEKKEAAKP